MTLKHTRGILTAWALFCLFAQVVQAGSVATSKIGGRESLRVTYTPDPDGTLPAGEMLITVTPIAGQPCLADREIEFTLYTGTYGGNSTAFSTKVFLAQGANSATTRLQYSQPLNYGAWTVDVLEDGQSIVKPRFPIQTTNSQFRKSLLEITFDNSSTNRFNPDLTSTDIKFSTLQIANSPVDWRGYLGYEAVIIGADSFEIASPSQLKALSNYVLAGGYLIIHHASPDTPLKVDQQFQSKPNLKEKDSRWTTNNSVDRQYGFLRQYGGGTIAVYEVLSPNWQDLVKRSEQYPFGDLAAISSSDRSWFWRNLVLSVGKTPIWSFVGFVTLFVIAVGPVMIRVTDKLRHRTLLLFLVPSFSLAATLLFMLFNVSRDGFSTYGRVAALHYYDVDTQQGFSWSRQSYFSGAPPREGLKFEPSTFLRPYSDDYDNGQWRDPRERVGAVVQLNEDSVILKSWMTARSQQSLLAGSPVGVTQFPISAKTINDEKISVKNETNATIPIVVLKRSAAMCFCALDLGPGETRELAAETTGKVDATVRTRRIDLEPKMPLEVDTVPSRPYNRYYYRSEESTVDPIDNALRKFTSLNIPDYGYWIVSPQLPMHPLPFSNDVYETEKHFLIMTGAYPW